MLLLAFGISENMFYAGMVGQWLLASACLALLMRTARRKGTLKIGLAELIFGALLLGICVGLVVLQKLQPEFLSALLYPLPLWVLVCTSLYSVLRRKKMIDFVDFLEGAILGLVVCLLFATGIFFLVVWAGV